MRGVVVTTLLVACGRYGFDDGRTLDATGAHGGDGATGDGANRDGATGDGSAATAVTYVGAPAQHLDSMGAVGSFTLTPIAAGDAVALMVTCAGSQLPTGVTLAVPGWTFTQLSPLTIDPPGQIAGASFGAIVPAVGPVTGTVTWTGANCNRGKSELADEFGNADATGGMITFDAIGHNAGTGNCTTTVTTGNANDAVWAGCYAATSLTGSGAGYTKSAADGVGDFNEYKLTADPAGTPEAVSFTNVNGFVLFAATIKPR